MNFKKGLSARKAAACALFAVMAATSVCGAAALGVYADEEAESAMYFNKIASYDTGNVSPEGGTAEIVHYNSDNNKMYLVNGTEKSIDIIALSADSSETEGENVAAKTTFNESSDRVSIDKIVKENKSSFASGFEAGEISSVAVNTELDVIAVAVQHSDYTAKGAVVLLDYDGKFIAAYETGVQPDNVVFSGNYILTADEGEPREGYGDGTTDPKGSVTIVSGLADGSLTGGASKQVYFDGFDDQRSTLVDSGVIIMKNTAPSVDFEPEYIAASGNGYAYVALQEANAIAILDIANGEFTAVQSLGFKDHSQSGNGLDLINDGKAEITTQSVYGVYMPDGMDIYTAADGTTYLITANEGDAREWGDEDDTEHYFTGVTTKAFTDSNNSNSTNVEVLDTTKWDGLDSEKTYVLGGRSFSVFKVTSNTIEMVYDSGDKIEQTIASSSYSNYFNCNSDETTLDARSKKKGPEPEDVTVYEYGGAVCVSVCMERQSGFVTFDISGIVTGQSGATAESKGYTTTRDFTSAMAGDVAPENLEYVAASKNALNKDLIIMANENSGTVSVYAIESESKTYTMSSVNNDLGESEYKSKALITEVYGTGDNTDGAFNYSFVTIYNAAESELDVSGWSIRYKSAANGVAWQTYTLKAVINKGGTYTVACEGAGSSYTSTVTLTSENYDAVWSGLAYFDNKDISIEIVDADGKTVDAFGAYDSTNYESGEGTLVSGLSKNKVATRKKTNDVYTDTNDNNSDFSVSSKVTTNNSSTYSPKANSSAKATAYITVDAQKASLSGISYLSSGYVLAGEVSFTVSPAKCNNVTEVKAGDTVLNAAEGTGAYSFTLSGDITITVSTSVSHTYGEGVVTAPTCTDGGYTTYTCTVCGDSYTDSATAATGHNYSISWTWNGYSSATATFTCANDNSHVETAEAAITSEITTAATAEAAGVRTYTATVTFGGQTYTDTKRESIAATGAVSGSGSDSSTDSGSGSGSEDSSQSGSQTDADAQTASGCGTILSGGANGGGGDLIAVFGAMAMLAVLMVAIARKKRRG